MGINSQKFGKGIEMKEIREIEGESAMGKAKKMKSIYSLTICLFMTYIYWIPFMCRTL